MALRVFIAVDVQATGPLASFSRALATSGADLKVVAVDILHITLKFLGDTEETSVPRLQGAMEETARGVVPFTLELKGAGAFPNLSSPRVVWVGVEDGGRLSAMARTLEEACSQLGFPREGRRFSPHLTLARARSARGREAVAALLRDQQSTDFGVARIDRLLLKKSTLSPHGPRYDDLLEVALA